MKPRTCANASKLMQVAKENSSEAKKGEKKKKEEKIKTGQSRRTHRHLGFEDKKKRRLESTKKLFSQQNKFLRTDRPTDRPTKH